MVIDVPGNPPPRGHNSQDTKLGKHFSRNSFQLWHKRRHQVK